MSIRILWRSTVFIITLVLIYLAFPILIVPSSLPAIKAMVIGNEYPDSFYNLTAPSVSSFDADAQIYQLNLPTIPTAKEKLELLKQLHQQGLQMIFKF